MHRGYLALWRKSLKSGLIKNHKAWAFWTWCLMKANYQKDFKQVVGYQEILLQPGQFIFGRKMAATELGMSQQNVRTCLLFLKKSKNLTIKSTNKFSIISIINWNTYQFTEEQANQQTNQRLTNNQPTTNQQLTTNNNNIIKELKNIKNTTSARKNNFDDFWEAYPKKKSKGQAKKTWESLSKQKKLPELSILLEAIAAQKAGHDWQKDGGKYIPYPSTWLNAEGWKDESLSYNSDMDKGGQHGEGTGSYEPGKYSKIGRTLLTE